MAKESFRSLSHFATSIGCTEEKIKKVLMPAWMGPGATRAARTTRNRRSSVRQGLERGELWQNLKS